MVGSLKMNTTLEYSTRVVQKGDRRCKKSTLNDLAYLTPLRIPLMNPVLVPDWGGGGGIKVNSGIGVSFQPARLRVHRLVGQYDDTPMPESTIWHSQGL